MIGLMHKIMGSVQPYENELGLLDPRDPCIEEEYFLVPKDYINFWPCGHKCEHEGCLSSGEVVCHIPCIPDATGVEATEHLCYDHAYEFGYCVCCGDFCGGIECYEINNPSHLCENCKDQIDSEQCDSEDDDESAYLDAIGTTYA